MYTDELARTFNCGIGMVLIVSQDQVEPIKASLKSIGEPLYELGYVVHKAANGGKQVKIHDMEQVWGA